MKKLILVMTILSGLAGIICAQNLTTPAESDSLGNIVSVKMRKTYNIWLISMENTRNKGKLTDLTDSTLVVSLKPGSRGAASDYKAASFLYRDINNMRLRRKGAIGTGILIGIVGGAIVGGLIGASKTYTVYPWSNFLSSDPQPGTTANHAGEGAFLGATCGGLVGALIGALVHKTFIIKGQKEKFREMQNKMMKKLY